MSMRFLAWHVEYFKAVPSDTGRSSIVEDAKPISVGESLLVFASFEKGDEQKEVDIVDKAAIELQRIASQLGISSIVLNPFAHLFGELASPSEAVKMLDMLYTKLADRNFNVYKLAFGRFYEIELKAKGHKLARISRTIN